MITSPKSGPVVLVTGAGRGLGQAIASRLATDGATVVVNDCDATAANATAKAIRGAHGKATVHVASVDDAAAADNMIACIADEFGQLDALVSNAGISSSGRAVAATDPAEVERLFRVHALGSFLVTRASLPLLRAAGGRIVFVSSLATSNWPRNGAPYAMAKAAVEALAWTLANEEERNGIRVNVVAPGLFDTRLGRELRDRVAARHGDDAGRRLTLHDPAFVAAVVQLLVGEDEIGINRQRLVVRGQLEQSAGSQPGASGSATGRTIAGVGSGYS